MLLNGAGCCDSYTHWDGKQVPLKCLIIQFLASRNGGFNGSMHCSLIHLNTCTRMHECEFLNKQKHNIILTY